MSSSSGPVALLSGGLIDELEWVRTAISSPDGWNFFESRGSEGNTHCHRKFRCVACTSPSRLSVSLCN